MLHNDLFYGFCSEDNLKCFLPNRGMSEYFCFNQNCKKVINATFLLKTGPGIIFWQRKLYYLIQIVDYLEFSNFQWLNLSNSRIILIFHILSISSMSNFNHLFLNMSLFIGNLGHSKSFYIYRKLFNWQQLYLYNKSVKHANGTLSTFSLNF